MSHRKFIKDLGILALSQLISAFSGIITLPVIAKLLGVRNFGIWTQLLITLSLISAFATLNLPYALLRFLAGEKDAKEIRDGIWSTITVMFGISLIIALLLIVFSGPISQFFGCDSIFIVILAGIIIVEGLNQVFYNAFRSFQQVGRFSLFYFSQELGEAGLVILAVYLGFGLFGALLAFLFVRCACFLIMSGYIIKEIGIKLLQFKRTKEYLHFALPTIFDTSSNWVIQSSDRYLIGFFLGTLFVGYYAPAYSIGVFVINFLIAPFSFLLPAVLSKFYDENKIEEVKMYLKYSLKYFLLLGIPAVFGLTVLSKQILTIVTTAEFAQAGYIIMPFVALSMLAMGAHAIIAQIIGVIKKTKISAIIAIIAAILNVGLNLLFIPMFGILGAALTTLIASLFIFLSTWMYSFKHLTFHIDWKTIIKSIVASSIMGMVVLSINPSGIYKTVMVVALGVVIYGILMILLRFFTHEELVLFKKIIKQVS